MGVSNWKSKIAEITSLLLHIIVLVNTHIDNLQWTQEWVYTIIIMIKQQQNLKGVVQGLSLKRDPVDHDQDRAKRPGAIL